MGWDYTIRLFDSWSKKERSHLTLPSIICWFVWLERNNKVFENGVPSPTTMVYKTLGMYSNRNVVHSRQVNIKTKTKTHITEGLITWWFDGAAQSDGLQSGVGGLLRISKKSYYRYTFNCGPGTNTREELLGVWATLHLASKLNIKDIQIIGDSKIVIDWLNNKGKLQVSSLLGWMDRVKELHTSFMHISYTHALREHNKEVDALSKSALHKQVGLFTYNHWIDEHEGPTHFLNLY